MVTLQAMAITIDHLNGIPKYCTVTINHLNGDIVYWAITINHLNGDPAAWGITINHLNGIQEYARHYVMAINLSH